VSCVGTVPAHISVQIANDWRNATWRNECGPVTPRRPEPGFALRQSDFGLECT
jgi:hypothetical protein